MKNCFRSIFFEVLLVRGCSLYVLQKNLFKEVQIFLHATPKTVHMMPAITFSIIPLNIFSHPFRFEYIKLEENRQG